MTAHDRVLRRAVLSEWIKLRSVRSTYLTLLCALLMGLVLGWVDTASAAHNWPTMSAGDRAGFDPVGDCFTGFVIGQLAFGVLGVLAVSSEYRTGSIRTTFTAVPRRGTVFAAKALVIGAVALVLGECMAFTAFFLGQRNLAHAHLSVGLGDPGVLRAVTGAGLYLFVVAMVGFGLGAVIRHTAGAVAGMFGLVYLAYGLARAFDNWSYLPDHLVLSNASDVLAQTHIPPDSPRTPSLGMAFLDLALYLAVALALGAWRVRRDP
ncbi:ABC transporter permease subunit [Actinacidiphila paucisporea]|uniref:ABC-type transport system involved in multi-copper enzyme maturation, permease component n=1 Tax=Actinacidiphila paucisporea TaxID=310782 RepID=A0A1M7QNE6_9ACTN|nr:ABC transporter permease subunit [Actinacidiphila paucisporea]SHN32883.1 ABC-type transport system involved in multi-copper enzyme maturation, permease component [Actinacidiphila paucisporea]